MSEETMEQKSARNARVQARYDELMAEGKHGHYETMFRVVREEVERERSWLQNEATETGHAISEYEATNLCLDHCGIPKKSKFGQDLSLWGRVVQFAAKQ